MSQVHKRAAEMNIVESSDQTERVAWDIREGLCVIAIKCDVPYRTSSLADMVVTVVKGLPASSVNVSQGVTLGAAEKLIAYSLPWELEGMLALRLLDMAKRVVS